MENEKISTQEVPPQATAENLTTAAAATTPEAEVPENLKTGITLKFNKELREVPYEEAIALAQKGLKFDTIRPDFERLKSIAAKAGKSISDYITEIEGEQLSRRREELLKNCAGNEDLTEHILSLENAMDEKTADPLRLLRTEFPEIQSLEDLPEEVLSDVELLGGNLLSAYLLYNHRQQRAAEESKIKQYESSNASVGSQARHAAENAGASEEFIKGIWS